MKKGPSQSAGQPGPVRAISPVANTLLHMMATPAVDALLILDSDGVVRFANQAAAQLFGRDCVELTGSAFGLPQVTGEGAADLEIIRPDGSVALASMHIQPFTFEGGPAFLTVFHDVTAWRQSEQLLIESQQFLRSTLDALSANIAILDRGGTIVAVNHTWQDFARNTGADPYRSGVGYNYLTVCDQATGEDAPIAQTVAAGIRAVIAGAQARFYLEYPCNIEDVHRWFALHITRFGEGDHLRVVVAHEDISQRKQIAMLNDERRQVLELVARSQSIEMVGQQLLTMIRQYYPKLLYAALILPDLSVQHIAHADLAPGLAERLNVWVRAHATGDIGYQPIERCPPGDPRWAGMDDLLRVSGLADCWIVPIYARARALRPGGALVIAHRGPMTIDASDIQVIELVEQLLLIALEQQDHLRQLAYQAQHDALTGLPNRVLFEERLERAIVAARRSSHMLAVLFIDLDRFKQINDTLGHTTGDTLLVQVARRFESCVRSVDTLARRGGDEFMLVLTEISSSQQVARVAERLRDLLQPPFHITGHELFVSASIGASIFPTDGDDADSLQRRADAAMYRAKNSPLSSFQFFDLAANQTTVERLRLENYLRRALERNELALYYQPKVDRAGRVVGVEALLRWKHPDLGMISPARFVPLAEELGLIIPIGAWCMARSFAQVRAWQRPGRPIFVAINVSIIQFTQPDFVEGLRAIITASGLDPSLCVLELTESMLIGDQESVIQRLNEIRALGVTLAIDDFGTGYSSLGYLRRMPISILKIDRVFVADIGTERDDSGRAIITSIITLAHQLGMHVVAEGVETSAQRDFLNGVGCDMIQGFFYSEALPPALFAHLLAAERLPSPTWKE